MIVSWILVSAVALYTVAAAITDLREHRIPNYLTVPMALVGLLFHAFHPAGFGLLTSISGLAIGFGLLLVPCLMGGSGMGDAKLLAALGAWLGPQLMLVAFALSLTLAAVLAIAVLAGHAISRGVLQARRRFLKAAIPVQNTRVAPRRGLPFAVPVALGTLLLFGWMVVAPWLGA